LDETQIVNITPEDKKYLEEFKNLVRLGLNQTQLKSLNNLPVGLAIQKVSQSSKYLNLYSTSHLQSKNTTFLGKYNLVLKQTTNQPF